MAQEEKAKAVRLMTPVGRLINHSLFEKDVYTDERGREATASYKAELAFDLDDEFKAFEGAIVDFAVKTWGAAAEEEYWNGAIRAPVLVGDELAKTREEKGKKGDVYAGKYVVRAHTVFNRNGEDGAGGVYVCGPDAKELDFADRGKVYNGCFGKISVTLQAYKIDGRRGITLYLNGFQLVKDGDRIRGGDPSNLFSPMMGQAGGGESKGRRSRG